jgi:hypothetical protein
MMSAPEEIAGYAWRPIVSSAGTITTLSRGGLRPESWRFDDALRRN